ncbi:ribonuclease P protein component [Aquibaculum sediminis]|uniref:ribonuclease P protein component n=1 Tax=Aquibaculum sediminis TaxID=3231907 RepID=UPI003456DDA6
MLRPGRLKKRPEFLRVAARGRKAATPGVVVQALARHCAAEGDSAEADARGQHDTATQQKSIRVGFTASRKVGNAVARNRARRRLRAAVDEIFPEAAQPCRDYVVVARRGTLDRPWPALLEDLRSALRRVERSGGKSAQGKRKGTGNHRGRGHRSEVQKAG